MSRDGGAVALTVTNALEGGAVVSVPVTAGSRTGVRGEVRGGDGPSSTGRLERAGRGSTQRRRGGVAAGGVVAPRPVA